MPRTREELKTARAELATKLQDGAKAFNDNGKKFKDAEEQANWDKLNEDYDAVMAEIRELDQADDVANRIAQVERDAAAPNNPRRIGLEDADGDTVGGRRTPGGDDAEELDTELARELAFSAWCRKRMGLGVTRAQRQAVNQLRFPVGRSELSFRLPDTAAYSRLHRAYLDHKESRGGMRSFEHNSPLSSTLGSGGGATIPPETLLSRLEINMLAFGGMRQVAETILTTRGNDMGWPTVDDTGNEGRILGESQPADDNAGTGTSGDGGPNPTFGKDTWGAYKWTSDAILVPYELLEDSEFGLAAIIGDMLGERLGRGTNRKFTVGTGAGEPQGIVTAATLGVTTASATAIAFGELIDLEHSVDSAYRDGAAYMCNDLVLSKIRQIVGTNGHPIYQANYATGAPDKINGRDFVINNHMAASVAALAKTVLFGQLSKYKIRRVREVRLYRLEERYREQDKDGFVAFVREDGGLLDAGGHPVKYLQQHS